MGGDDLSDDEQYLNPDVGPPSDSEASDAAAADEAEEEEAYEGRKSRNKTLQKKRSRARAIEAVTGTNTVNDNGSDDDDANYDTGIPTSKKRPKNGGAGPQSQRKLLLEAARGISKEKTDVQAAFLWTCYTHALKMKGGEVKDDDKFQADHFYAPSTGKAKKKKQDNKKKEKTKTNAEASNSMTTYLKGGALTSMKRLKKWKCTGSPMVIIVCLSARRSVQILKQLSPLNVRCAKLFAKHMDLDEQIAMLRTSSFGIAVGTPNRMLKLLETESGSEEGGGAGALSLDGTELLVIDNQQDSKAFTVCTLNDTAPDLIQFLDRAVIPQMRKRQTLKLAMF